MAGIRPKHALIAAAVVVASVVIGLAVLVELIARADAIPPESGTYTTMFAFVRDTAPGMRASTVTATDWKPMEMPTRDRDWWGRRMRYRWEIGEGNAPQMRCQSPGPDHLFDTPDDLVYLVEFKVLPDDTMQLRRYEAVPWSAAPDSAANPLP